MQPIDYSITVVYLLGIIIVGLLLQKKASAGIDSYFLGNRKIPWWALGASGMASNLDITGTMINTALVFALGISGFFIEIRGGICLLLAFLMIFMGKWTRRARVMTVAEWMRFRFGDGKEGDVARLLSAISSIVVTIAMITYFAVGAGKFVGTFLGLPDIGRIDNPLTQAEIQQIDRLFKTTPSLVQELSARMRQAPQLKTEEKSLSNSFSKLATQWQTVIVNPQNITELTNLNNQITACKNQVRSTNRNITQVLQTELKTAIIQDLDKVSVHLNQINTAFEAATQYSIVVTRAFLASTLMIVLAMIYTVASGLFGVVWTDVFQSAFVFGTIVTICFMAFSRHLPDVFNISMPMRDGTFMAVETSRNAWSSIIPSWKLAIDPESSYSIYNFLGIAIMFYLIKIIFEGTGGAAGYMAQRYFAASTDREAGLLSMLWTFLLSFRWAFISAIAILGITWGMEHGVISDPERVLPVVVNEIIPVGLKGFLVAGLMAAAMSTFDSTVNAGAAYWTKDIYQAYIRPKASDKQLMFQSRFITIVMVLLGLFFSLAIKNINDIWGWITMSIGAGMFIPLLVRWYWWRMNGYGFAWGTAVGMVAAILQKALLPKVPEYVAFSIVSLSSLVAMIIGTYLTRPTDEKVLKNFYLTTRPFGFWNPIRKQLPAEFMQAVNRENRRDLIAIFLAVPWQLSLFLIWMALMMKRWDNLVALFVILIGLSIALYYLWYRHLSTEVKVENR